MSDPSVADGVAASQTDLASALSAASAARNLVRDEMTIVRVGAASGAGHITRLGCAPAGQVQRDGVALQPGAQHEENLAALSGGRLAGVRTLADAALRTLAVAHRLLDGGDSPRRCRWGSGAVGQWGVCVAMAGAVPRFSGLSKWILRACTKGRWAAQLA